LVAVVWDGVGILIILTCFEFSLISSPPLFFKKKNEIKYTEEVPSDKEMPTNNQVRVTKFTISVFNTCSFGIKGKERLAYFNHTGFFGGSACIKT
jgi:hypothetical protein